MSIKVFDYECDSCGRIVEHIIDLEREGVKSCRCGGVMKRIISFGRPSVNETWTRDSAAALLDMEIARRSSDPIERALALTPNRENLQRYMKAKNLRFAENEKGAPPVYRRPEEPDLNKIVDKLYNKHRERNRIEL
jgi:hypothetical protein